MITRRFSWAALAALVLVGGWALLAQAEITDEQKKQGKEIEDKLAEVAKLIQSNKNDDAGKLLEEAQTLWTTLASGGKGADYTRLVDTLKSGIGLRRRVLEGRGVKIAALAEPAKTTPGKTPAKTPAGKTPPAKTPATGQVSFMKEIVPIFAASCRNCHINANRGMFSMATYNSLMNGKGGAAVIEKGSAKKSRFMEVLESGEMPQGGRKLTEAQVKLIATWIDQGAKYDGDNPSGNITANLPKVDRPKLDVVKASGKETIKFSRDIAPVIASQCTDCHGAQQPRAQLGLDTFARLLRGSNNGLIVTPGKPDTSELIKRLKGQGVARMPQNKPALANDVIAKFVKWVEEGAKFDGMSPDMPTETVAKIYQVSQMSHDELAKERITLANDNWKLANPDDKATHVETKNFLLVGNVGESRLKEVGDVAEKMQARVVGALGGTTSKPLVKGRATLFVFGKRFDYSEYGQMVEKREIPKEWQGHFKYTIIDAYACICPPQTKEEGSLDGLVAEQLAGVYVESLGGNVPGWFSQGTAWAVASNMTGKDPRINVWNDQIPEALSKMKKADDFLTNQVSASDGAVLNYSYVKFLMSRGTAYRSLLNSLRNGAEFQQAFLNAFKGTPAQIATLWAPGAGRKKP